MDEIRRETAGRGADHVFEAVGRAETVRAAIALLKRGGSVTLVGNLSPEVSIPLQTIVSGEATVRGSCASSGEYPASLDLVARRAVDVAPLISATAPLHEGAVWFERLHAGTGPLLKVILRP